jgi:CheY-like chemotaxis protein
MNLVANAVRYTNRGGIVVGCRRRGDELRVDVCDSGPGIPGEQQRRVFDEYYRLPDAGPDHHSGFGLGLAIVDRLGRLLRHRVELVSRLDHGSRFSVLVPLVRGQEVATESPSDATLSDPARGKLVLVIDDDALVRDGMSGILRGWGCTAVTADSEEAALSALAVSRQRPDLIISDFRLAEDKTGIEAIACLRDKLGAPLPAFLISGDTAPERLREARLNGLHLLHKPVTPMRLRAMLNQLLLSSEQGAVDA